MGHTHFYSKCLFSGWTHQQKVAYLPRPGGGAVEKMGRYYSYYNRTDCTLGKDEIERAGHGNICEVPYHSLLLVMICSN